MQPMAFSRSIVTATLIAVGAGIPMQSLESAASTHPRMVGADVRLAGVMMVFPLPESGYPSPPPNPTRPPLQRQTTVKGLGAPKAKGMPPQPHLQSGDTGCPPGCEPWPEPEPSD